MNPLNLDQIDRDWLLMVAREAIAANLRGDDLPSVAVASDALRQEVPVFVTLWLPGKELRGCVGRIEPVEPLPQTVQYCAIAAANRDFRFSPVAAAELSRLTIEISLLTPPQKIASPTEIEVGRHGLIIKQEEPYNRTGLLLPDVPTERGWNREQFLHAICIKAGLPESAWQNSDLFTFETEKFTETLRR